jgi:hypothetical protein
LNIARTARRLRRFYRNRGLVGASWFLRTVVRRTLAHRWLLWHLLGAWWLYLNRRFDRRNDVNTAGISDLPEGDPRFRDALEYGPTPERVFRAIIRSIPVDYSRFCFVDVGAGKGKGMMMASRFGFKQIVGVELSENHVAAARENFRRYQPRLAAGAPPFEMHCVSVLDFELPTEPIVFYLFNPFRIQVMREFLTMVRRSLAEHPRDCYLAYYNPVLRGLLNNLPFLRVVSHSPLYSVYKFVL